MASEVADIAEAKKSFSEVVFKSNYEHLADHNGFRPGELHVLIGPKGTGKSSLLKGWMLECIANRKRIFLHLSEEVPKKYLIPIYEQIQGTTKDPEKTQRFLDQVYTQSEKNYDNQYQQKELVDDLEIRIRNEACEIAIIDNFTTSVMSRLGVQAEGAYIQKLTFLAEKLNIPIIVVSHTEKAFRNQTIATSDNVRGNASISNTGGYIYVLNAKLDHPEKPAFIYTDKARYHNKANKAVYRIFYDTNHSIYYKDERTDFESMTNYWKEKKRKS